eukprot:1296223-Rhodomonas_salina.6
MPLGVRTLLRNGRSGWMRHCVDKDVKSTHTPSSRNRLVEAHSSGTYRLRSGKSACCFSGFATSSCIIQSQLVSLGDALERGIVESKDSVSSKG